MATTASIAAAVPSVATAGVAAYAGISPHNTTSRPDLSGEGGNRASACPACRGAGYGLAEISVNKQDHDQEKYS
jgi:hypothetical protein